MKVSGMSFAILICAVLLVSGVSAQDFEKSREYEVTPAGNLSSPLLIAPLSAGTITQGQMVVYTKNIPSGTTSLITDLNWGNPANSLALTIIGPDVTLGPYYDSSDGNTNGRIYLQISKSTGLSSGLWEFRVYGYQVSGTQSYNFYTY